MATFQVGDKVRFRYTGDYATIIQDYLDGSYSVWLDADREESVAFAEDIVLASEFKKKEQSNIMQQHQKAPKLLSTEELFYSQEEIARQKKEAWMNGGQVSEENNIKATQNISLQNTPKTDKKQTTPTTQFTQIQTVAPTDSGLYIGFLRDAEEHYTIYLINDTPESLGFEYKLYLENAVQQQLKHLITAHTFFPIGELEHHQLNDSPVLEVNCPVIDFAKTLKIRYKGFAAALKKAPLMSAEVHLYQLFDKHLPKQNIENYTRAFVEENKPKLPKQPLTPTELKAAFPRELDLHIEQLVKDPKLLKPHEMLDKQLKTLEDYLYKAAKLEVESFFVIHGVGEGTLQKEIAKRLKHHPLVLMFRNEQHPKYGVGATEVFLRK